MIFQKFRKNKQKFKKLMISDDFSIGGSGRRQQNFNFFRARDDSGEMRPSAPARFSGKSFLASLKGFQSFPGGFGLVRSSHVPLPYSQPCSAPLTPGVRAGALGPRGSPDRPPSNAFIFASFCFLQLEEPPTFPLL